MNAYIIAVLFASLISLCDYAFPCGFMQNTGKCLITQCTFIEEFIKTQMLQIMGTILAINIGSVSMLHLTLNGIEERLNKADVFDKTRQEIKHNVYFLIICFCLSAVLIFLYAKLEKPASYIALWVIVSTFTLYMYALFEMVHIVFSLKPLVKESASGS